MKKRDMILAVLAVILVLSASIGAALAYFTSYAEARGGYVVHMGYETEIEENVEGNVKTIRITNTAGPGTDEGTYPVFVRVKVYHGSDCTIKVPAATNWKEENEETGSVWYYTVPLYTGETTEALEISISVAAGAEVKAGDPIDVIVTYESVPAVFNAHSESNSDDNSPDMATSWANAAEITAING